MLDYYSLFFSLAKKFHDVLAYFARVVLWFRCHRQLYLLDPSVGVLLALGQLGWWFPVPRLRLRAALPLGSYSTRPPTGSPTRRGRSGPERVSGAPEEELWTEE